MEQNQKQTLHFKDVLFLCVVTFNHSIDQVTVKTFNMAFNFPYYFK